MLYAISIPAIKISILFLYRRIFPSKTFKQLLILTGAFLVAYSITLTLGIIFQCVPLKSIWIIEMQGTCIQIGTFSVTMSVINVITDVILLILPMPMLWNLKISTTRRWQLMLTFALGGLYSNIKRPSVFCRS